MAPAKVVEEVEVVVSEEAPRLIALEVLPEIEPMD
jgi:hypothetical protein